MMRPWIGLVLVLVPLGACAQPPSDCPPAEPASTVVEQPGLRAAWRTEPAPSVSAPFVLKLALCPLRAELLRVDATMPEHRHGMNYRPRVRSVAPGQWLAEGLVWHMPGRWELVLTVALDGQQHRLVQSVMLR